jgi:hypothetical protein
MVMNSTEIFDAFWPPVYISDVQATLRKFDRNQYGQVEPQ